MVGFSDQCLSSNTEFQPMLILWSWHISGGFAAGQGSESCERNDPKSVRGVGQKSELPKIGARGRPNLKSLFSSASKDVASIVDTTLTRDDNSAGSLGWDGGRGLHSSTFRLNVSAFCGRGGAFRGRLGALGGVL